MRHVVGLFGSIKRPAAVSYSLGYIPSGCSCRITHPTCLSQASVSMVFRNLGIGNAKVGGDIKFSWRYFISFFSTSFKASNLARWFWRSFALSGGAIRSKFGTNRRKTFLISRKDFNSVIIFGYFSPRITSSVCSTISCRPGRITRPK